MTSDTLAAVLWDMDGTLIDSEPLWIEVELAMLRRYGLEMSAETHERMIGSGLWEAAEHFRELGVPLSADEIVAEWVESVERGIAETEPRVKLIALGLLALIVAAVIVYVSRRAAATAGR